MSESRVCGQASPNGRMVAWTEISSHEQFESCSIRSCWGDSDSPLMASCQYINTGCQVIVWDVQVGSYKWGPTSGTLQAGPYKKDATADMHVWVCSALT